MADCPKPRSRGTSRSRSSTNKAADKAAGGTTGLDPEWLADVEGLSFQDARTALELAMAQLQSDALEVEEMAGLYRRAEAYARRCEAVLQQVEQQVIQWDAETSPPSP